MAGGIPPVPASVSRTPSATPSITRTPSRTPSVTPSPSKDAPPPSLSSTPSITPTITPSISRTPSLTPSVSISPSTPASPSVTPTVSRTPSITPTPSSSPDCNLGGLLLNLQINTLSRLQTAVGYYKLNLSQTEKNIYGESLEKWYYKPVLAKCAIERSPDTIKEEMFGPDIEKNITLTFPKAVFDAPNINFPYQGVGLNLFPEIGDIVYERSLDRYFEVHNIIIDYEPFNTNIGTSLACPPVELVTYKLECHHTRVSRLNLLPDKLL
jgi:hypothetical protein